MQKSLAEPWADTTHEFGEVFAALVGYVARKTREDILRRTAAGRQRARARGVFRTTTEIIGGRTPGGARPPRGRRAGRRDRAVIRRQPLYDLAT